MKKVFYISLLFLFMCSSFCYSNERKEYLSPDKQYRAVVVSLPKASYGSGESEIIIETKDGKILYSKSYGSEDGQHGFGVEHAAWTPDSQFFAFSMSSSGGHQAWHFPTYFISTKELIIQSLDGLLGPITEPNFEFVAPDIMVTVGQDRVTLEETDYKVSLSELTKNKNAK